MPGFSATAWEAALAKRFELPTTNESNRYWGLSELLGAPSRSGRVAGSRIAMDFAAADRPGVSNPGPRFAALEQDLVRRALEVGDRPVDDRAEALFERLDEARVRRFEDEVVGVLRRDPQGMKPGAKVLGREIRPQLPS